MRKRGPGGPHFLADDDSACFKAIQVREEVCRWTYSHTLRQVEVDYPSASAAATVIADLVQDFPLLTGGALRNLAELLASHPGMPTSPSLDGVGDHYTVLRCVRSGDEDCLETGNEWMSDGLGNGHSAK